MPFANLEKTEVRLESSVGPNKIFDVIAFSFIGAWIRVAARSVSGNKLFARNRFIMVCL